MSVRRPGIECERRVAFDPRAPSSEVLVRCMVEIESRGLDQTAGNEAFFALKARSGFVAPVHGDSVASSVGLH